MARQPTIADVAISRLGYVKGLTALRCLGQWTIASAALERPITLQDYEEWWEVSERTAYYHRTRFREAFPELPDPQPLADVAIKRAAEREGVSGVGRMPSTVLGAV